MKSLCAISLAYLSCALLAANPASASIRLDFNDLTDGTNVHGAVLDAKDNLNNIVNRVMISGDNINSTGPNSSMNDPIVVFDTFNPNSRDQDLEDPFVGGNAATDAGFPDLDDPSITYNPNASRFHEALIIQEVGVPINTPDDEGRRAAGSIIFDFENPISSIGFDLLDVEGDSEIGINQNNSSYDPNNLPTSPGTQTTSGYVGFFGEGGSEIARVGFNEFTGSNGAFSNANTDPNRPGSDNQGPVVFGNKHANRFDEITIDELEDFISDEIVGGFKKIEFNFGGSGAIDNLVFQSFTPPISQQAVPEASSLLIWAVLGLANGRAKRKAL